MADESSTPAESEQQALEVAWRAVLLPLARLALAHGQSYAALDEQVKRALVQAAAELHPGQAPHRSVSRISTATGIHRREVTRLTQGDPAAGPRRPARSLASEVFTHWISSRPYRQRNGQPRVLPRLGPVPSFESLAQTVTRDVHARSLLDELLRLNLAVLDEEADTVSLRQDGFVPRGDRARMLGFLADNVGDHLAAAVANVAGEGRSHFEQAIFADGLSAESLASVHRLVGAQWKLLLEALVPPLERLIEADAARTPDEIRHRLRIGLYGYDEPTTPAARPAQSTPAAPRRRPRKR